MMLRHSLGEFRQAADRTDPDDLSYSLRISVWVRWLLVVAWLVQHNYRVDFEHPAYVAHTLFSVLLLALNGYVHYRIETRRTVTWRWALALSAMDAVMLTAGPVDLRRIREHLLRLVLRRTGHVRGGIHIAQAQLRGGHGSSGRVHDVESDSGAGRRLRDE